MNPSIVEKVASALTEEPTPAELIAKRANLGRNQTYQALVRLYDQGKAFMAQRVADGRMQGWTS